jgi:hypothetical protein
MWNKERCVDRSGAGRDIAKTYRGDTSKVKPEDKF